LFFSTILNPKNRAKIFTVCSGSLSPIGRGRISREGALDLRESRERRDKIFAERTENAKILDQNKKQFSVGHFYFFGRRKTTFWGADITSKLASQ
jgi:hypothetical protein